jgi:tetratricopeptide (TPR) repeat protein
LISRCRRNKIAHFLAANAYENEKSWDKAGRAYISAAELKSKIDTSRFEAVTSYASAAKAFRAVDPQLAIRPLEMAIEMCKQDRKRDRIPRYGKQLAELYAELGDMKNAVKWYKECAELLQHENMTSGARGDLASAAALEGKMGLYREAADDFLTCAKLSLSGRSGPAMRPLAKKDIFNAAISILGLVDEPSCRAYFEENIRNADPEFVNEPQGQFVAELIEAIKQGDEEKFDGAVRAVQGRVVMIDDYMGGILTYVYEKLAAEQEDFS